jgi:O-antigen ligase
VAALSVLAACLFVMLTNNVYWERISTISYKGEEIEGVDTGGGRLQIIDAQWRMFEGHPLGCGHMCTTVLSTSYLDQKYMSSQGGRASHNTFMTMLVDHGAVGGIFYVAMIFWIVRSLRRVKAATTGDDQFIPVVVAAVAATLGAITVGDLFVQYPKLEVRFWFVAVLMILVFWSGNRTEATVDDRRQAQSARKETIA